MRVSQSPSIFDPCEKTAPRDAVKIALACKLQPGLGPAIGRGGGGFTEVLDGRVEIGLADDLSGDDGDGVLQPDEAWVYTCDALIDATTVNTATVRAEAVAMFPAGQIVSGVFYTDTATATVTAVGADADSRDSSNTLLPPTVASPRRSPAPDRSRIG